MSKLSFKRRVIANIKNLTGWRTTRKILVLESDDWGSLRMPDLATYEFLKKESINLNSDYDTIERIESSSDLSSLFEVLNSVKDKNGRAAVITPFYNTANPNFEKIIASEFQEYHFETFDTTIARYEDATQVIKLIYIGMEEGVFQPEYHGREHLNVPKWMKYLKNNVKEVKLGCQNNFYSIKLKDNVLNDDDFQVFNGFRKAFYYSTQLELDILKSSLNSGIEIFESIFKRKPNVFDPANSCFSRELDETLNQNGIKTVVVNRFRQEPTGSGGIKKVRYEFGQYNPQGQVYYIRNCVLEPFAKDGRDATMCMGFIDAAFRWNKPAIISTHRVNYVGSFDKKNRDLGLKNLKDLLKSVVLKYPDVEFMSSSEFAQFLRVQKGLVNES